MYFACMYVSVSHGCLLLQLEGCLCVLKGYGSVNLGGLVQGTFFLKHKLFPSQWRYCIRLENLDSDVVQLRERHWRIFSLSGTLETVRGRGVVGRVSIVGPL